VPMLPFCLDQVHLCPSLLHWHFTSPLRTSVKHCHPLPWTIFDQNPNHAGPHAITLSLPPLVVSTLHLHVLDFPLPLLDQPLPSRGQTDACTRQQPRAQTTPRDVHARQDAHAGNPGRDRTPLAPVVLTSSRPLPLSYALTVDPATSQTTPSRRGNPVRDATVDDVRRYPRQRPHALVLVSASFSSPSSPTSPP
jgi:hypothetical protein